MKMDTHSGIILTAGMAESSMAQIFGPIPTGLVPVYGRPIIKYIIDSLIKFGITTIYIAVGHQSEKVEKIVHTFFRKKARIIFVEVDKEMGPGNSLLAVLRNIGQGPAIINLADTFLNLCFQNIAWDDCILASADNGDARRWCMVEADARGCAARFYDKVAPDRKAAVLIGLYCLSDLSIFDGFAQTQRYLEISDLLNFYMQRRRLKVVMVQEWLDFGHIDKYHVARKRLLETRSFNSLEFDDLRGTVTKRSKNKDKFRDEILMQTNLPMNIAVLFPRILDYTLDCESPHVTMEYFGYSAVSDLWLYGDYLPDIYDSIVSRLYRLLGLFRQDRRPVDYACYRHIYIDKTEARVEKLVKENAYFKDILSAKHVRVNGNEFANWYELREKAYQQVRLLFNESHNCLLHGDYCFSNILYDINSGIVRLIDPRGKWGRTCAGDIKYDIAKLRHSIHGEYDFIVNDLFDLKHGMTGQGCEIAYSTLSNGTHAVVADYFDKLISADFNPSHIKLVEGLLFMSMIAYHPESLEHQIMMFVKAIEILNPICKSA